jgi:hypothetical protein
MCVAAGCDEQAFGAEPISSSDAIQATGMYRPKKFVIERAH